MAKKADVREETKKRLSKYGTEALLSKLEKNALMGISEEIALEILEAREAKAGGSGWAKNGSHENPKKAPETSAEKEAAFNAEKPEEVEEVEEEPIQKPEKEEAIEEIEKSESIEKVEKTETLGSTTSEEHQAIINGEGTNADKVRKFHALGLTILQISKIDGFEASYRSIRGIVKKIEANG